MAASSTMTSDPCPTRTNAAAEMIAAVFPFSTSSSDRMGADQRATNGSRAQ